MSVRRRCGELLVIALVVASAAGAGIAAPTHSTERPQAADSPPETVERRTLDRTPDAAGSIEVGDVFVHVDPKELGE